MGNNGWKGHVKRKWEGDGTCLREIRGEIGHDHLEREIKRGRRMAGENNGGNRE